MLTQEASGSRSFDLLPEIKEVVRDSIKDGLVTSVSIEDYDATVAQLTGSDLENYLQTLWDEI